MSHIDLILNKLGVTLPVFDFTLLNYATYVRTITKRCLKYKREIDVVCTFVWEILIFTPNHVLNG